MRLRFCAVLFLCTVALSLFAKGASGGAELQKSDYFFSELSVSEGLSQNTVLAIEQDVEGNLWLATIDGLNKFDAYDITVYRHFQDDSTSLGGNNVRVLLCDSHGRMWAGTDNGLSRYDSRKNRFYNWQLPQTRVTGIEEIDENQLLVGTERGLKVFDISLSGFVDKEIPSYMSGMPVMALYRYEDNIYIGTEKSGLFVYSVTAGEFRRISFFESQSRINVMLAENADVLWIGTEGDGLFKLDFRKGEVEKWRHSMSEDRENTSISSNYVRSLGFDEKGNLWIGTFNGLNIMSQGQVEAFYNDPFVYGSLSQNSVRSIFQDNQGGMWLGTYFGGVNYWHPLKNRFRHIYRTLDGNSLNDNIISCIVEDDSGLLWIGTNSGGVNMFDTEKGEFRHYPLKVRNRPADMESNDVKAIFTDSASPYIYIGAHAGGLNILDRRTGQIAYIGTYGSNETPTDVYSIIRADKNHLWVGSLDGLLLFDTRSKKYSKVEYADSEAFKAPKRIKALHKDAENNLWVGGEDGLIVYDLENDLQLASLDSGVLAAIGDNTKLTFVQCFFESSTSTIWIGTRNGLYRYSPTDGHIGYYTTENGLPDNTIRGIEEDSHGRLWISTDCGLSCFNPYSDTFRNYTINDGLQSNLFNTGAHCRTSGGEMYFGGINGVTCFVPEKLEDSPYSPKPLITNLKVLNKLVLPDDETGILSESISSVGAITLRHKHNYFTLEFSVPDYLSGGHNTFAYRLEGFDKIWNISNQSRTATYSNLPRGKYRFVLKAANSDGKWNETPAVLEIRVKPVWYKSLVAYIFFFLLAVTAIVACMRLIVARKNMENRLKLEKQESEHNAELSQMKMRFFINISHELRSPLTLIINPLQEMVTKASDIWMRKQLKYVERNARRMLHLVNQLMDYRRADLGVFKLKLKEEDVNKIVRENWSYYENLAKSKKLKYSLKSDIADKRMYIDAQYVDLILNNLLSNAFKYTEEGNIAVELFEEDNFLVLKVRDTGIGIADTEKDKIFERFYQLESKHIGSGIGLSLVQRLVELHHGEILIESEEGKGSTFTVKFPQDLSIYTPDELDNDGRSDVHTTNTKDMYTIDTEVPAEDRSGADNRHVKRGKILIAEDNEEIRTYMYNGLSRFFEIILTSNGAEALEKLKTENDVDIIITDLMMPVMDGMKLCAAIKQNSDTNHIPVIMLSAKTEDKDTVEALTAGADDYILKPFSMSILSTKVQNMMRTYSRMHDRVTGTLSIMPEKVTFNVVDEDFLNRAIAIIERNMDNVEFSTDTFAREMNMSRSNLHIRLKAITGESALEFIHRVRFKEACRLLEEGRYTVSEISDKTGFSTPSYFATCFKKYMGCIPSDYVKKNQ